MSSYFSCCVHYQNYGQRIEEKKKLDEEIQKSRTILDQENIDVQTIEEFKKLKEELNKRGISIDDPRKFRSVVRTWRA